MPGIPFCPVCGSEDATKIEKKRNIEDPFTNDHGVELSWYRCNACTSEGDFLDENDKVINDAKQIASIEGVKHILDRLKSLKISFAAIERALDLPQRTLTKWRTDVNKPSASGVALIRMLGVFPWLLEVAECKYDRKEVSKIFVSNAVQWFLELAEVKSADYPPRFSYPKTTILSYAFVIPKSEEGNYQDLTYKQISTDFQPALIESR